MGDRRRQKSYVRRAWLDRWRAWLTHNAMRYERVLCPHQCFGGVSRNTETRKHTRTNGVRNTETRKHKAGTWHGNTETHETHAFLDIVWIYLDTQGYPDMAGHARSCACAAHIHCARCCINTSAAVRSLRNERALHEHNSLLHQAHSLRSGHRLIQRGRRCIYRMRS